jgi:hypothetical protein
MSRNPWCSEGWTGDRRANPRAKRSYNWPWNIVLPYVLGMLLRQLFCYLCTRGWINHINYVWKHCIFISSWRVHGSSTGMPFIEQPLAFPYKLQSYVLSHCSCSLSRGSGILMWCLTLCWCMQVPGILFTPICPHSLSFRPLILPEYVTLRIQVPFNSRGQAWASFDGKDRKMLSPGDALICSISPWPVPTACLVDSTTDFLRSIHEGLHWNLRKTQSFDGPWEWCSCFYQSSGRIWAGQQGADGFGLSEALLFLPSPASIEKIIVPTRVCNPLPFIRIEGVVPDDNT